MSIIKFLCGESEFRGYWFGDKPGNEGAFWWRKHLREYDDARTKEIATLKKVYNDLAESHAKQVIEIGELKKESREWQLLSDHFKAANQVEILEKEIERLDASEIIWFERNASLESELLKAKERFCQCNENDKTGSTSAMHCNHCGKIEQSETWLK